MSGMNHINLESAIKGMGWNISNTRQEAGNTNSFFGRDVEEPRFIGTVHIKEGNTTLWTGKALVTKDGKYYTIRFQTKLPANVSEFVKVRGNLFHSDRKHPNAYFRETWDATAVSFLESIGVKGIKLLSMDDPSNERPEGAKAFKPQGNGNGSNGAGMQVNQAKATPTAQKAMAQASQQQALALAEDVDPDLAPGWSRNKFGRVVDERNVFVSNARVAEWRANNAIAQVQAKGKTTTTPVATAQPSTGGGNDGNGQWSAYDMGKWLGTMDRERGYESNAGSSNEDNDFLSGYEDGYAEPEEEEDEPSVEQILAEFAARQAKEQQEFLAMLASMKGKKK